MGEINLTRAGLLNAAQHGITPEEVWQIAGADNRVIHPVGEASRMILAYTRQGRGLAILVQESQLEDDVWDVVAAREMTEQEATHVQLVWKRRRR